MDFKKIVLFFVGWRILLFVILFLFLPILSLQTPFLGGALENYLKVPQLWGWVNFDGVHYLALAKEGYRPLTYFYFPLYPILTRSIATLISSSMFSYAISGLLISNLSFLIGLVGLVKLIRLDYSKKIVRSTLFLLLLFPTSFYFGSMYTESLFFALTVWAFYYARKGNWVLASVLGGLSSATRVVGLALIPAFAVEIWLEKNTEVGEKLVKIIWVIIVSSLGLLIYMYYLKLKTGSPFEFFSTISIFGQQRSAAFIPLPQVFYRYIFKVLPAINYDYFPVVFTTWLEFLSAITFLILSVVSLFKLRLSYSLFLILGYLVPTLSGSFSSLPRYVLPLFPAFILSAIYLNKLGRKKRLVVYTLVFILLSMATALFLRGYWVS